MSFRSRTIRRRYARTSKRLSTSRFFPLRYGVSKRRMGASNGARSTCCLPKPPGFKASGRRFGKSVASYVRAKSRRTASGRSTARAQLYLVSSLPAAASPQALLGVNRNHWRIEIMHRNKDVILGEDETTPIVATTLLETFSLSPASFSKS